MLEEFVSMRYSLNVSQNGVQDTTAGGRTYSFEEIKSALESAGFIKVNLIQPDERMTGLVEGFKP